MRMLEVVLNGYTGYMGRFSPNSPVSIDLLFYRMSYEGEISIDTSFLRGSSAIDDESLVSNISNSSRRKLLLQEKVHHGLNPFP